MNAIDMSQESFKNQRVAHAPSSLSIDWEAALRSAQDVAAPERLLFLLKAAGCVVHPEHPRVVMGASVKLWTMGGLPIHALERRGLKLEEIADMACSAMGVAGSMSYLALPGGSGAKAFEKVAGEHGHFSIAHAASVSLVVAGVSCAVENEFNSQRDLAHLARVTVARTKCQSRPPIVALDPKLAGVAALALEKADELTAQCAPLLAGMDPKDADEFLGALYPAAKASAFILTGSLRSLQKLLAARFDLGKEREYIQALDAIHAVLSPLWPTIFKSDEKSKVCEPSMGASTPPAGPEKSCWEQHWAKPKAVAKALQQVDLSGRAVVELGAGTGNLTRGLIAAGAGSVRAWEIDPDLPPLDHALVKWIVADLRSIEPHDLKGAACVSFAPYELLPLIVEKIEEAGVEDALLLAPPKHLNMLSNAGYRAVAKLSGADFEPVANGSHWVMVKGFASRHDANQEDFSTGGL
jgi:hypothetical protein